MSIKLEFQLIQLSYLSSWQLEQLDKKIQVNVKVIGIVLQKDLSVRESRFDALFQQLNDIKSMSESENADWSLSRLCNVEEIVEQSLVVMTTEEIKLVDDEDKSLRLLT